jgi:light-harvesting protein B-800-850 beta chain
MIYMISCSIPRQASGDAGRLQAGSGRVTGVFLRSIDMSDRDKVWPTGLTEAESEEIHRHLIQGTQLFGMIAAFAHLLAYIYSPWLH